MLNTVQLVGFITRDLQIYPTCTKFTICVRRVKKDQADYLQITTFGAQKAFADKYLCKGRLVSVEGRIESSFYEKEGKKYYNTDIIGLEINALDKPPKQEGGNEECQ